MTDCTLHLGDCRDVLATLPDASVAAIVTDPPYGQSNEGYDSAIAFDPGVWRECARVAGPNAALVSFAGSPTYHRIASAIEAGGWRVRQMWGWIYRDGLITSAWPKEGFDRLRPAFDPICFATRGKVLLDLEREGEAWDKLQGRDPTRESFRHIGLSARSGRREVHAAPGHRPTSLAAAEDVPGFEYFLLARTMGGRGGAREKAGHPNQKPESLLRWLLAKLPGNGPILDPFAGSGTTGIAALDAGRPFVGIEVDPEYHAIAARRLAAVCAEPPLFAASIRS